MTDRDKQQTNDHRNAAPTKEDVVGLYRRAVAEIGAPALWNIKEFDEPTIEQALAITR